MDGKYPQVAKDLAAKREFTADIKAAMNKGMTEFNEVFQATPGAKA
jgi:F-type H+-transporting ATPase subunit alpha